MTNDQKHDATRQQIAGLEQQLHASEMQRITTKAAIDALKATLPEADPSVGVPSP